MDIPAKLYKYRSLNTEARKPTERARNRTKSIIETNSFWYGRGSAFNDPFDCNFDLPTDRTDEEWADMMGAGLSQLTTGVRNRLSEPIRKFTAFARSKQEAGVLSDEPAVGKVLDKLDTFAKPTAPAPGKGRLRMTVERDGTKMSAAEAFNPIEARRAARIKQSLDESFGVLCLSERPDDLLLWSHYASEHKGICLEFDTAAHAKAFPRLAPVRYADEYPELVKGFHNLLEMSRKDTGTLLDIAALFRSGAPDEQAAARLCIDNWFYQKCACWRSEREWRSLVEKPGLKPFPAPALSGVVVGCKTTDRDIADIRGWIKGRRRKVKLYRAVKRSNEFALDIVPLD